MTLPNEIRAIVVEDAHLGCHPKCPSTMVGRQGLESWTRWLRALGSRPKLSILQKRYRANRRQRRPSSPPRRHHSRQDEDLRRPKTQSAADSSLRQPWPVYAL